MNTSAIINPIAATATGKQSAVQIAATPDVPFNQVLSREVANRHEPPPPEKPAPASAETSPATPVSTSQSASKAPRKSDTKEKEKTNDDSDKSTTDAAATDSATQTTPANILALVANIEKMTGADKTAPADDKPVPEAKLDVDAAKSDVKGDAKGKIVTKIDTKAIVPDKEAPTKDVKTDKDGAADFASELKRGTELQKPAETLATKAQSALGTSEAAALESAAKKVDKPELPAAASAQAVATLSTVQQAAQTSIHAAPGNVLDRLSPQVGTPAWDRALGQRVVWMVAGAEQSASLTLNPPDLGPLQVVLNVQNSTANATFVAAQPEVRQALEAAMPKLRDMLGDAGIQLGQATVSSGMQQNQNGSQAESSHRPTSFGDTRIDNNVDTKIHVPRSRVISSGNGLVDTFV